MLEGLNKLCDDVGECLDDVEEKGKNVLDKIEDFLK